MYGGIVRWGTMDAMGAPLWTPTQERVEASRVSEFVAFLRDRDRADVAGFDELHRWSVTHPGEFWRSVWDFFAVVGDPGERLVENAGDMTGARFLPDARLNVAENLLARADDGIAVVERGEDGRGREVTWSELRDQAGRMAAALAAAGVGPGDRVAAWLPNGLETLVTMLGATWIGATFSSTSPDFGVDGVVDRFGQIEPRVLVAADGYHYGGRAHDCLERLDAVVAKLPSLAEVVVVPRLDPEGDPPDGTVAWSTFLGAVDGTLSSFERFPTDQPWYVLYSSGTTGKPKCIVHRSGGLLLKHLVEHQLHGDVRAGDRVLYYTTAGWMMWNWLASALASGATLLLYDGSPFEPDGYRLFAFAAQERCTFFGTSARFLGAAAKAGLRPNEHFDLGSLRTLASTGSPLAPEGFDYVYQAISDNVQLASISGGTDILSCFVGPDPTAPVRRGEIQAPGLGMAVEIWDEAGQRRVGQPGELVCTRPFPSLPLGFGADPDGSRYRAAYFEHFPGVWRHGDLAEETVHGGYVIHGRSDAVLNPGGVRIGTAEIYRQVEQLDEVLEALAVGQQWQGQERVVLFVKLRADQVLDDALEDRIRAGIRAGASPRHVPALILQAPAIPRTRSGKLTELAVRELLHGRPVTNREALANPEALEFFEKVLAPAD